MAFSAPDLSAALELTRAGRLMEATRAIQAALGASPHSQPAPPGAARLPPEVDANDATLDVMDVTFREIAPQAPAQGAPSSQGEAFTAAYFHSGGHRYRYRLFVPARASAGQLLPVVVMLHGCKQDADDFARGTGMNALAAREQAIVVYPEQLRKGNSMGCWNWFEPGHQRRGAGEPAMIAALAQQVAAEHGGDPARIYVAGLSAGAAMATLLGTLYPDVFAAVGAHSGLPPGAAADVPSAFAAMRNGAAQAGKQHAIPTIVVHGSADKTVAPRNAKAIVQGQLDAWSSAGTPLAQAGEEGIAGGRTARRTVWADAAGQPRLEVWKIDGGPHAWSGGDAGGSFTDPQGPAASAAMLAFFLQQRRAA